jgi:hypothetical protein
MASEAEVRTDIKQRYSFRNSKTLGEGASCKVVSATRKPMFCQSQVCALNQIYSWTAHGVSIFSFLEIAKKM